MSVDEVKIPNILWLFIEWMWYICYSIIVSIWNIDNAIMDQKGINILEGIEMRKWRISYRAIHNLQSCVKKNQLSLVVDQFIR